MSEVDSHATSSSTGTVVLDSTAFRKALDVKLDEKRADGGMLALLLVECGLIGHIDAVWGFHVGDAIRGRIGVSLSADVLRGGDFVGEMGRDEFACLLSPVDGSAVALLAAQKALRALDVPFWVGDDEVSASPAIGVVVCSAADATAEALLQRAKSASLRARGETERIAEFDPYAEDPVAAGFLYRNRLRTLVAEDGLELVFQPQFDLRLGQVMGAVCLLSWRGNEKGLIATDDAFAAAEASGQVPELVFSILNRALRIVSELRYSAGLDLRIGVKLPARALLHDDLPEMVERALGTWSRRPGSLILEIGGTVILASQPVARANLSRLKELGVKLSIDDPQMALASLFWLAGMPFQEIKIDVAAVNDLAGEVKAERILQSIIELAHGLRLAVAAVGVANEAVAARLKEMRCDYMLADFKGPALDPKAFIERFGFSED